MEIAPDLMVILPETGKIFLKDALERGFLDNPLLITKPCPICGKSFTAYISEKQQYCSPVCSNISQRGKSYEERYGVEKAEEIKEQMRKAKIGKSLSPIHRTNISKTIKELWKDPKYVGRVVEAWGKKPNKLERMFDRLLRLICPKEFKYVGNRKFILGDKRPDFLNINGKKKLIEVYGDFFHKGDNPQERIDHFKKFGYDTLVIWEHEIRKEPIEVAKRVLLFIGRDERSG